MKFLEINKMIIRARSTTKNSSRGRSL